MVELDEIDRGILQLLQVNARHLTPGDMADQLPVSRQTVRNRLQKLEDADVIEGYVPLINYREAGYPLRIRYTCTAPVSRRGELARAALEIPHIVAVDEMLSARENLGILAVATDSEQINDITKALVDLELVIEREALLRHLHMQPFNHFGTGVVSDS